jgi:hypothetical protein
MKKILFIIPCLLLLSCGTKKTDANKALLTSTCPKDGTCTLQLLKNKSMLVKNDEFGRPYYTLEDNAYKNTFLYTYSRTVKGNIQDAGYREEIVFELDKDGSTPPLANEAMQRTKMLFGRFCFCKGQTGYYKVTKGALAVASNADGENVALDFEISEVPQIIKNITMTVK